MTTEGASNRQDEINPEHSTDGTNFCCPDGQLEDLLGAEHGDAEDSPGKILIQSVTDILAQSAQSVKALVSGNKSPTPADGNAEEKTLVQSVQERFVQTTQSVKEAITGGISEGENGEEKGVLQAVGEKIVQSAKTVKDAVKGDVHIIPGKLDLDSPTLNVLLHWLIGVFQSSLSSQLAAQPVSHWNLIVC